MVNSSVNKKPTGLAMIKPPPMCDSYCQIPTIPTIAIEDGHLDCLHGPIVVSPLNLASQYCISIKTEKNVDLNTFKQKEPISTPVNHNEHTRSKKSKKSKEIQTNFTSFTRETHYYYPKDYFNQYLILDSSESMPPNGTSQQAQEFNTDFFTRFGRLFSMRFIEDYFHTKFKPSKL